MLVEIVAKIVTLGLLVLILAAILPGIAVEGIGAGFIAAIVLILFNSFIKPVLKILTFPINIVTLGLFSMIINLILLYLTAWLVPGFTVENLLWGLVFTSIFSLVSTILNKLF